MVRLVATLPCHNDAEFLEKAVKTLKNETAKLAKDFVVVIAEDGSKDGSAEIARKLAAEDKRVLHIHADKKLGRGKALMNAWSRVNGDIYVYVDCDLATDMQFYPRLIKSIKNGCDLATGSRYVAGAVCHRPPLRRFSSLIYNCMIRLLFRDWIRDHQCGFKAFSKRMVEFMLKECRNSDWFWDTEAIVLACRNGFKVYEFPVRWTEKKGRRTPLKRLVKDVWIHGKGILDLLRRM